LLTCEPVTGRTHQIRIHLCSKRLPICGDGVYGGHDLRLSSLKNVYRLKDGKKERPLINRVALHAQRLTLVHPNTKQTVEIFTPLPKDMTVALKYLRRYSNLNGPPLTPGDEND
jgi:23S rRNA-/tRNA-specific pseudouridylate synthase